MCPGRRTRSLKPRWRTSDSRSCLAGPSPIMTTPTSSPSERSCRIQQDIVALVRKQTGPMRRSGFPVPAEALEVSESLPAPLQTACRAGERVPVGGARAAPPRELVGSRPLRYFRARRPRLERGLARLAAPASAPTTTKPRSTASALPARGRSTTNPRPTAAPRKRFRSSRSSCSGSSASARSTSYQPQSTRSAGPALADRTPQLPHPDRGARLCAPKRPARHDQLVYQSVRRTGAGGSITRGTG